MLAALLIVAWLDVVIHLRWISCLNVNHHLLYYIVCICGMDKLTALTFHYQYYCCYHPYYYYYHYYPYLYCHYIIIIPLS
jgi:hypothetical protein